MKSFYPKKRTSGREAQWKGINLFPLSRSSLFAKSILTTTIAAVLGTGLTAQAQELAGNEQLLAANDQLLASRGEVASRVESVTVNARRRDEDAQSVPIPIAAIEGGSLESFGQFRLEDLNQKLPSTNVYFQNPRQSSVAVRGLGNNPANDALESSVGVYLDNVYLGRPGMANLDLIDIEQVALLRGPQGTLFGKNTTAGVLNIGTRKPSFTPEVNLEASYGNFDYYQLRGAVTGPLTDTLAGRLSLAKTKREGFIYNTVADVDTNGTEREGVRGQLLFEPSDTFDVRVTADYNHEDENGFVNVRYKPGPNDDAALKAKLAQVGGIYYFDDDYRRIAADSVSHMTVHQGGTSAEANWDSGSGKLTSITAWRFWKFTPHNDGDGVSVPAITDAGQQVDDKQWSQELRWASPTGDAIDYVGGLYYFYQEQHNNLYTYYGPAAGAWLGRAPFTNATSLVSQELTTDSSAAFAQATWHVSDPFSITGGLRYTYEKKSTNVDREAPTGPNPLIGSFLPAYESGTLRLNDDNISALLSAAYQLDSDVLLYGSASLGAKSGGINPAVPPGVAGGIPDNQSLYVDPEKATDYELGFKSTWLDQRLQVNANLYWTDVDDYQSTWTGIVNGVSTTLLTNVGGVRSRGVEAEIAATPIDGLTLALVASFNDVKYTDYENAPCSEEDVVQGLTNCDLSGEAVYLSPRWIANPSISYETAAPFGLTAFTNINYAWRSKYYGGLENSEDGEIGAYGLLNLRVGVRSESGQWNVAFWGNNVLDKTYFTSTTRDTTYRSFSGMRGLPATYGVTVGLNF
jgi:iron complex outermembrane receptor protein